MSWRRPLRVLCSALALLSAAPALPGPVPEPAAAQRVNIAAHVTEASQRFGIPEHWIYAVMRVESAGRIGAVSSAGAMGLMQLMPGTWARQRARFGLGSDPFDPRDNIMAGTSYLREMYDSYGAGGFLAAYNAGPGRYADYRDKGRPLPAETRTYVGRIAPMLQNGSSPILLAAASPVPAVRRSWTEASLFALRSDTPDTSAAFAAERDAADPPLASARAPSGLFAPVSGRRSP